MSCRHRRESGLANVSLRHAILLIFLVPVDLDLYLNINRLRPNDLAQECHRRHRHWHCFSVDYNKYCVSRARDGNKISLLG